MFINELFLQYVWQYKYFDHSDLRCESGEELKILKTGQYNSHSGPDFFDSRIYINDALWVGNVELHVVTSDWKLHKHDSDPAYRNVILHVVYDHDEEKEKLTGNDIPVLSLKKRIPEELLARYFDLIESRFPIACGKDIKRCPPVIINGWLDRVCVERLERKSAQILQLLVQMKYDWNEVFYTMLAKNYGFLVNALPFEMLARSLPENILSKHRDNPFQVEALLFGQSGLLNEDFVDEYPAMLKKEYRFLRKKYTLKPIDPHIWKFMRLRPKNFPTVRLAQFANMVIRGSHSFSKILETESVEEFREMFHATTHPYWQNHYTFDKKSGQIEKTTGEDSINNILINTVVPFLYSYSELRNEDCYKERALKILDTIGGEENRIVRLWRQAGIVSNNSFTSQALIELFHSYCSQKKCLSCSIGNKLISEHGQSGSKH